MKMKKRLLTSLISAMVISGCGDVGQDSGDALSTVTVSAQAIDGYIADAFVFIDTNGNETADSWETKGYTDSTGNLTLTATESLLASHSVTVTSQGGFDTVTRQPFLGTMQANLTYAQNSDGSYTLKITPLTTLLSYAETDEERTTMLTSLDISEDDLKVDYLDSTNVKPKLVNKALKVHKFVEVISKQVEEDYTDFGESEDLPPTPQNSVYNALSTAIKTSSSDLNTILESETTIQEIFTQTETKVRENIQRVNELLAQLEKDTLVLPSPVIVNNTIPTKITQIITNVRKLPAVIDDVITTEETDVVTLQEVESAMKLTQVVTDKVKKIVETEDDSGIQSVVDVIVDDGTETQDQQDIKTALLETLEDKDIDLENLVDDAFDFTDSEDVEDTAKIDESAETFESSSIAGKQLKVSDPDLKNNQQDREGEFYFLADGVLKACIKFVDSVDSSGEIDGEGNFAGLLADGTWTALDDNGHDMLITLDVDGITYKSSMKSIGDNPENSEQKLYKFDYLGEINRWYSTTGLVSTVDTIGNIPTSDEACEDRMPTRINATSAD